MRGLIWVLVAVNLLLVLWSFLRPESVSHSQIPGRDDAAAGLVLLSELQDAPFLRQVERCLRIGPFSSESSASNWLELSGVAPFSSILAVPSSSQSLSRVVLSAEDNAEQAQERLIELRAALDAATVQLDHYLVASGELLNKISMGLFSAPENAVRVQSQLAALGFVAEILPENRLLTDYWISMSLSMTTDETLEKLGFLTSELQGVGFTENLCETIALPDDFP
jgi:hypothetical protein